MKDQCWCCACGDLVRVTCLSTCSSFCESCREEHAAGCAAEREAWRDREEAFADNQRENER